VGDSKRTQLVFGRGVTRVAFGSSLRAQAFSFSHKLYMVNFEGTNKEQAFDSDGRLKGRTLHQLVKAGLGLDVFAMRSFYKSNLLYVRDREPGDLSDMSMYIEGEGLIRP
jgi:hypothetical protein